MTGDWIPTKEVDRIPGYGVVRKEVGHGGRERWVLIRNDMVPLSYFYMGILVLTIVAFYVALILELPGRVALGIMALGFLLLMVGQHNLERKQS